MAPDYEFVEPVDNNPFHELLPKGFRSFFGERNVRQCHYNRYFSPGRLDSSDLERLLQKTNQRLDRDKIVDDRCTTCIYTTLGQFQVGLMDFFDLIYVHMAREEPLTFDWFKKKETLRLALMLSVRTFDVIKRIMPGNDTLDYTVHPDETLLKPGQQLMPEREQVGYDEITDRLAYMGHIFNLASEFPNAYLTIEKLEIDLENAEIDGDTRKIQRLEDAIKRHKEADFDGFNEFPLYERYMESLKRKK